MCVLILLIFINVIFFRGVLEIVIVLDNECKIFILIVLVVSVLKVIFRLIIEVESVKILIKLWCCIVLIFGCWVKIYKIEWFCVIVVLVLYFDDLI